MNYSTVFPLAAHLCRARARRSQGGACTLVVFWGILALPAAEIIEPPAPVVTAAPLEEQSGLRLASPFWGHEWWEDGLAEVAEYNLQQQRYGQTWEGRGTLIAVREFMDPQRAVKSTNGTGTPVIKAHLQRQFQTGNYPYSQSMSALIDRQYGRPQRFLMSSHEWCGTAGKSWVNQGYDSTLRAMSYFNGHGDTRQDLDLGEHAVLADTLWLWVRAWVAAGQPALANLAVVDSQIEAKTVSTTPRPATISAKKTQHGGGWFSAGTPVWRVVVERGKQRDIFLVDQEHPHRLRRWQDSQGSIWELRNYRRFAYWKR